MSKITESARNQPCSLKLDQCNGGVDNETVVFAHKNGAGMGQKYLDEDGNDVGFYARPYCHAVYDRQITHPYYKPEFVDELVEFAIRDTTKKLVKLGLK